MDRLVCGDVGYGKTEIALRAAFKTVQSGRQVGILVPTTVLAQQHLETFSERLEPFPASVEMLSRFRTDRQQKEIIKKIANGSVDIVIGTHRLLQKDIHFKDLGLVIIDEEHKFGVSHKERLKRLRTQVDVMTLSATPIPRTLHMSLAGVRDTSTIETPPEERLPIKTYVSEESDDLTREAILRELDRDGQVFYLHNRVKDIELIGNKIQELVPEAIVGIAHGQMPEDELEQVMAAFERREFNILLCTTIIESGIDLPNVNTLIVDRADMFGLSQLYQLRGRIGRGTNRAYAYLMVPRAKQLTEQAEQRLNTILAATELGAGFQIALRDLEIRGIGNLLGSEQSGQISAIGFDLYTKLLAEAVRQLKELEGGQDAVTPSLPEFSSVRVDIGIDARIPDSYIEDLAQRLSIYQRLARINSDSELDDLDEEIRDRFGPMPTHVKLLMKTARMRILAGHAEIDLVAANETRSTLSLQQPTDGARVPLQRQLGSGVDVGHMQIRVQIDRDDPEWIDELMAVIEQIKMFKEQMIQMMDIVQSSAADPSAISSIPTG
jgi:transcription-repair coupling factor (superfamily II helicase)